MAQPDFPDDTFLARWLAGELTPEEMRAFEARADYPQYKRLIKNMARMQVPGMDVGAGFRDLQAAREARQGQTPPAAEMNAVRGRKSWARPLLAAAATVALLLTAWFLWTTGTPDYYVAAGAPSTTMKLSDGSSIQLHPGTSLDFERDEHERSASLTGEAYFDVKPSTVPFVIRTAIGQVTVVGTSFNVFSRSDSMRVSVTTGRVEVRFAGSDKVFDLQPGQAVSLNSAEATREESFEASVDLDWLSGRSTFVDRPLREVLDELVLVYDLDFVYPPGLDQAARYNVTFPHDRLDLALENTLGTIGGYTYTRDQRTVTLTATN